MAMINKKEKKQIEVQNEKLVQIGKELAFQNEEKEKRADELSIADKELVFQNEEKEKRAAELIIANKELAFQNDEKEKRAAELIVANKELIFQNREKEKRADELFIANKELVFQNQEKEKRAEELIVANKEHQRAEEVIKDNDRSFRELIESLPLLFWTCRVDGPCDYLSKQWVEYTGIPEEEQLGYHWLEQLNPDDRERTIADWTDKVKNGKNFDIEFRLRRNDGVYRWFKTRAVPLRNLEGNTVKWFGSNTDFDDIKKIEEQLRITMQNLERSNKELEQFAYIASHDLQEPLRMVASFTQLLAKRYKDKLDDEANDFINFAVDGAKRMQRLINDLLEYSRVTSRGKPLEKFDLSSVLGQVIATMQHKIQDTNAMVYNEDFPFIIGDEIQISRVFQNLIDNALKFRRDEPPRIHISSKLEGEKVIISVSDNGIGINEKFNDRVFTIFQRLNNREDYPGTGIGLAVCKRIIERHGGKIWFESEEGKGTTFYFTLNK